MMFFITQINDIGGTIIVDKNQSAILYWRQNKRIFLPRTNATLKHFQKGTMK